MKKILRHNKQSIGILIISIVISVVYFFVVSKYANEKVWDTLTTFISTILSIVIGTTIGVIIYNYQKNASDTERLSQLKTNLAAEFSDLNRILTKGSGMKVNGQEYIVTYLQTIVTDECCKSGLFTTKLLENLLHLSRKIKFYNSLVNYFLQIISNSNSQNFSNLLENCTSNLATSRQSIINDINKIKNDLKIELSNSINS